MKLHCFTRLFSRPVGVRAWASRRRSWPDAQVLNRLRPTLSCFSIIKRFSVTALVLAGSLHAQDLTSPEQGGPVLDRVALFDELVTGSIEEGEQLLRSALEIRPRATPVELPLGHQLGYAACRAMETKDWARAVLLAGRAFAALDVFLAVPELTDVQRARALAIKAYITEVVLLDDETALTLALEALRLDAENANARAIVDRLPGGLLAGGASALSVYDTGPEKARGPSLSFSSGQDSRRTLVIQGVPGGTYCLETSTDLQSWTMTWKGWLEASSLTMDLNEATESYRFYRIRLMEGTEGD